jgi:hypothetical protein
MSKINFYSKNRAMIMLLSNFHLNKSSEDCLSFSIDVNYSFIKAHYKVECYLVEIENLVFNLKKLYSKDLKTVYFEPLERQITLKLNWIDFGNIIVEVQIHNQMDSAIIYFKYEIDQSFLPELIGEISTVLANVNLK